MRIINHTTNPVLFWPGEGSETEFGRIEPTAPTIEFPADHAVSIGNRGLAVRPVRSAESTYHAAKAVLDAVDDRDDLVLVSRETFDLIGSADGAAAHDARMHIAMVDPETQKELPAGRETLVCAKRLIVTPDRAREEANRARGVDTGFRAPIRAPGRTPIAEWEGPARRRGPRTVKDRVHAAICVETPARRHMPRRRKRSRARARADRLVPCSVNTPAGLVSLIDAERGSGRT